jgi:hypothetical protein
MWGNCRFFAGVIRKKVIEQVRAMIFKIFLDKRVEQTLRYTSEKKLGKNTKK